jgi:hypothetical protein
MQMYGTEQVFRLLRGSADLACIEEPGAWEEISAAALKEGVAPLLAFSLRGQLTGEKRRWCDRALSASWARHDRNLARLKQAAGRLEKASVPFVALKGPILAARYYSPPFLRKPSCDLDLAIRQVDLETACAVLAEDGYLPDCSLRLARQTSHHLVLSHATGPRLELHFRLSHGPLGAPAEPFLTRSVRYTDPDGFSVRILHPTDEIMHLVLHLVQDRFSTLFHFLEVWKTWQLNSVEDRNEAVRRAVAYRFAGVFALADAAFRYRMGEPLLPEDARLPPTWLNHRINEDLYRAMRAAVMFPHERTLLGPLRGRWLDLQTTDGPYDALRRLPGLVRIARQSFRGSPARG